MDKTQKKLSKAGRKGGKKRVERIQAKKHDLVTELRGLTTKRHLDFLLRLDLSVNDLEEIVGLIKSDKAIKQFQTHEKDNRTTTRS